MRALVLDQPGENPQLAIKELPVPPLGPRDVLVRVSACGLCYHDVLAMGGILRRGVKPRVVLGHEIAGEVVEVGQEVASLRPGDRVASILTEACGRCARCRNGREHRCLRGRGIGHRVDGGFAQYVRLGELSLVPLPPGVDLTRACIFGCPMGVALQGVRDVGDLQAGETALVTGAGGGLGVHALQVARLLGARVLAVTTSETKAERVRALGADEVILAGGLDFSEVVMALTRDRGVDAVIDTVGSPLFPASFHSLAQFGRMVLLGEVTGTPVNLNLAEVIFRDARILSSSGTARKHVAEVAGLVAQGKLQPILSRLFPLEEAKEAYELMVRRKTFGRVAVTPW